MLVVVKDGNIHLFFQTLFNDETFRRLDILKVDPAERRPHQLDRVDECLGVFGVQLDVDRIHVGEPFEQHRLALHHRFRRQRTKVAQAQNGSAVGNHRDHIALVGIVICQLGIFSDRLTGNGNTGGIGEAQIPLGRHRDGCGDFELARRGFKVKGERLFGRDAVFGH